ncbi:MAG: beta-N-acetylhexosaminidase [Clostridia bacterium]|nr:beta-N-acetylhexosaminidase [Clostridia bacterium]
MKNFDYFGVMVDCSRNAVPSVSGLKKFFDIISKMGYNCAMLYTEDTYEVEGEPFFGYKRGRYSLSELRELDEYAESRGIELIPCIQTLAHLNAIFRWNEYKKINDIDDILIIDDERTYELIDHMFASLSKTVKSRKLHIGMDEAHNVGLGKYLDRHGFCNRYDILLKHLNRVCEMAKKHGFEVLMWNDMFFRLMQHGDYRTDNVLNFPKEITEKLPENCTMVYWDYYGEKREVYDAMITSSKNLLRDVWFAGGAWTWGGFMPHNTLSNRRNSIAIPACIEGGVKNAIFTMWGDNGGECPYFSALDMLMKAAAIAEVISEEEMRALFKEITGEEYDAFMELELPNYIYGRNTTVGTANYSKNRLYDDPFLGTLSTNAQYEVDTKVFAEYAAMLHKRAAESPNFACLFETAATLCDCLEIKFYLSNRTRALYAAGDKDGLRTLAENDYTEAINRTEKFHAALCTQWYAANKTYGFEVQDIRLGGLIQRLKSCKERLISYANGEITEIAELCEDVLPFTDGNVPEWSRIASANIL